MLLITGATGSIGRAVLARIAGVAARPEGPQSIVLAVRNPARALRLFDRILQPPVEFVTADITKREELERLSRLPIREIVHMAAATRDGDERTNRLVNVLGTANVLALARQARVEHFVFFSSDLVSVAPQGAYACSKREAERRVAGSGVPFTILRPALVMSPLRDGVPSGFASLVKAAGGPVFPMVGDGELRLKPLFADDLADIVLRCLEVGAMGQAFDLAGDPVSVREFVCLVGDRLGHHPRQVRVPLLLAESALLGIGWLGRAVGMAEPPVGGLRYERSAAPFGVHRWLGLRPTPFEEALAACLPRRG